MSLNLGVMSAAVTLDDAEYRSKMSGLEGVSENTFRRIAQLAAGFLSARALFGFISGAMAEFSKVEEGNNKLKYTYTELREEAARAADTIVKTYNVAQSTATNSIANIGDMLTGLGFSQRDALGFAKQITERGIDVASFKGLDQTEVIRRMTVALTGETESLKTMGVVIRQGSDEFKAQVNSIMEATGATETMAKAQVILQEIMKQTANAEGDYLRPDAPRTYAQELTDLREAMKQFKAEVGSQVQPITQEMVVKARELLQWYNRLTPSAKSLANTTAALAASMLVLTKTGIGRKLMTTKGRSDAEIEAEKVKAYEKVIRAEKEKTDALQEAIQARNKLRIAEEVKLNAEKALEEIQNNKRVAESKGDAAAIAAAASAELKARAAVTAATIKARKAESEYHVARQKLATATASYNQLSAALPGVLLAIVASSTLAGKATAFMSMSFRAAAVAVKKFFASIGPVGWAIIGLAVAFEAASAAISYYNGNLEENARKAGEAADAAAAAADKNAEYNTSQVSAMKRLEELGKHEQLNNNERKEAERLMDELGIAYDGLGRNIDEMIAKQDGEKKSLAELIKMRKEELKQKRIAALQEQLRKNREAINANDEKKVGAWGAFFRGAVSLGNWTGEGKNREIDEENQKYIKANDEILAELERLKRGEDEVGETAKERLKKNAEQAKTVRAEMEKLTNRRWELDFNDATVDEQVKMLQKKMDGIFSEYKRKGKYKTFDQFAQADISTMSEKELQDLREMEDLEERIYQLRKQSADVFRQESESYQKFMQQRKKRQQNNAVERRIKAEEKKGNKSGVDAIMQREYQKARDSAKRLQREYEQAVKDARADGLMTEEEKIRISELKKRMMEAMSDADRWRERISQMDDENWSRGTQKVVGNFSAAVLKGLLGASDPQKETAKNTKELVRIQHERMRESDIYLVFD